MNRLDRQFAARSFSSGTGWAVELLGLVGVVVCLAGCTDSGPPEYLLNGAVTYDGSPVQEGGISFVSQDPSIVDEFLPIRDGRYEGKVKAGKKKVVITATREEGEVDPAMGARKRVSYLPPRYSSESLTKLSVDVTSDETHDFHLVKP